MRLDLGFDDVIPAAIPTMLRLLLLAVILAGLGMGLSKGWIEIRWDRLLRDAPLPHQPEVFNPSRLNASPSP
jgi:hypothetical protein